MKLLHYLFDGKNEETEVPDDREERRQAIAEKMLIEYKRQQEEAKTYMERLVEQEREERKAGDAKLTERQNEFDKRLASLENKVRKLNRDIKATNERINEYYGRLDWYLLQQSGTVSGGTEFRKWQDKIENITDKIRNAENKVENMKDTKRLVKREIEAA